ncbi:NUDIX hydrolase [Ruegeria arenilitoris]|uniref:NUDIX hydrolase n=1 Tax=Ruegeria arenilitoris TaxID=1173585 RepID=UPI00147FC442|nr:NUDIX domain-containing protein [Ruegeria arenilitoris]
MTIWRPHNGIRVKAIGLLWQGHRLLVADVHDDSNILKGVRPLGGSVEFGETWQDGLKREFREELGVEIEISSAPLVLENIYTHEGAPGHEIIFAADVTLAHSEELPDAPITFREDNGIVSTANWRDIHTLDTSDGPQLFPNGLKQLLISD